MNYDSIFYAGILLPTVVTVTIFVVFLVCWFKLSLRERVLALATNKSDQCNDQPDLTKHIYTQERAVTDLSETGSDSAIDVSLVDDAKGTNDNFTSFPTTLDDDKAAEPIGNPVQDEGNCASTPTWRQHKEMAADAALGFGNHGGVSSACLPSATTLNAPASDGSLIQHRAQGSSVSSSSAITVAAVHVNVYPSRLKKGTYPSIETLAEECDDDSPHKLYEWSDTMSDFMNAFRATAPAYASVGKQQSRAQLPPSLQYVVFGTPSRATADQQESSTGQHTPSNQHAYLDTAHMSHSMRSKYALPRHSLVRAMRADIRPPNRYGAEGYSSTHRWQRQYASSSTTAWTPNIHGSTSSNNDTYSAMGTSRV